MELKKTCQNCLWFYQCRQDEPCEDFDSMDSMEREYKADLHMRAEEYQLYIDEMNGDA